MTPDGSRVEKLSSTAPATMITLLVTIDGEVGSYMPAVVTG